MKKVLSLILALAMVFALVACGEKQPASDGDASSDGDKPARGNVIMTFGTADTGGSMYPAGAAVSQVWTNNVEGVKCNTQTSTGSFQNCQDVSTGEVDVAVATSDVVLNAYNGTGKFADIGKLDNLRVIGAVYTSVLSGVALKSSGLTYIHELLGKRVAVGPAASATENATLAAFGVMGIDSSNTSLENLGLGDGADSVGDGILDAAFGFAGLPIGGQLNLAATKEIQVLDMTQEEIDKVLAGNAAYIQTKIPAGTYTGQDNDANTFGVKCLIIVTADMDADLVYDLCKAMNEHTEELAAGNALLKDMTDPSFLCTQMPIPLHDGAQKYYSEQGLI
ncbi:MAG: TAXI family TRAP transporter solute-binding subunit [Oscillibacter sp.]|nr:TAXI family TRAP transporter solute-binding subunit [Oscillospiraceae bacterium]MDD7509362.1 TAXI family TRAP transporter solute-binding subunit [Oscillibacter sp.]MDY5710873.1 TAXI family TRAP transporter solute-binding subunit [Oscillospiraceae bacterium]MDY6097459.1 TAXI family TRAP transporter solute-binding subunit [Oscillospiraceae bacterium]